MMLMSRADPTRRTPTALRYGWLPWLVPSGSSTCSRPLRPSRHCCVPSGRNSNARSPYIAATGWLGSNGTAMWYGLAITTITVYPPIPLNCSAPAEIFLRSGRRSLSAAEPPGSLGTVGPHQVVGALRGTQVWLVGRTVYPRCSRYRSNSFSPGSSLTAPCSPSEVQWARHFAAGEAANPAVWNVPRQGGVDRTSGVRIDPGGSREWESIVDPHDRG